MSRFIEFIEWVESEPFGSEIGSYNSKGYPTSKKSYGFGIKVCAIGHFCDQNKAINETRINFIRPMDQVMHGFITDLYDNEKARTREEYLNKLVHLLPDDHKLKIPVVLPEKENTDDKFRTGRCTEYVQEACK